MNFKLLLVMVIATIAWTSAFNLRIDNDTTLTTTTESIPTESTETTTEITTENTTTPKPPGCNECQDTNNVACINEKEFVLCVDGKTPGTQIFECHGNQVCTSEMKVCVSKDNYPEIKPTCVNRCGECDETKTYACIDRNTYALCLGTEQFTNMTASCGSGEICSVQEFKNNKKICTRDCNVEPTCDSDIPIEPITTTTETITVPTEAPESAEVFCSEKAQSGFHGSDNCRFYYYCELTGKQVTFAVRIDCEDAYYDEKLQECTTDIPERCK